MFRLSSQARLPRYQPLPSVDADRVRPLLQERGDVVGLVLQALVVAGPAGREDCVPDPLTVDGHLVEPVARYVGAGPLDFAIHGELAPQHRRRPRLRHVVGQAGFDPAGRPVGRLQQARLPEGRLTPGGGRAAAVPDPHAPEAALARPDRRSRIDHVDGFGRRDHPRVPEQSLAVAQRTFARRHLELVGGLCHAATASADLPAQARRGHVDANGIRRVLGAQFGDGGRECSRGRRLLRQRGGGDAHEGQDRRDGDAVRGEHGCLRVGNTRPGAGTSPSWPTPYSRRPGSSSALSSRASSGSSPTSSRGRPCPGGPSCRRGWAAADR